MTARPSLAQARVIATRMSEDLAVGRAWYQGAPYVSARECPCDCGHELSVDESYRLVCENCGNFEISAADTDGKCYAGFIFTKHDAREA